jgi:homoserine kinase type II
MSVFTELSDADRGAIAEAYGIKSLTSVIGITNGDTETTYLFRTGESELIVTLFENGAEPLDLEQAFDTMDNLCANGVPCPKPRRTLEGHATTRAADRLVAVVSFLAGSPAKDINPERSESVGRVMGQIHTRLCTCISCAALCGDRP